MREISFSTLKTTYNRRNYCYTLNSLLPEECFIKYFAFIFHLSWIVFLPSTMRPVSAWRWGLILHIVFSSQWNEKLSLLLFLKRELAKYKFIFISFKKHNLGGQNHLHSSSSKWCIISIEKRHLWTVIVSLASQSWKLDWLIKSNFIEWLTVICCLEVRNKLLKLNEEMSIKYLFFCFISIYFLNHDIDVTF